MSRRDKGSSATAERRRHAGEGARAPQLPQRRLQFQQIPGQFAVCKLPPGASLPDWAMQGAFTSTTRTAEEFSIVCPWEHVPAEIAREGPWACLKLQGPFPFELTGVLHSFIGPLAENAISIFAMSTFDTDYVLIKDELAGRAVEVLRECGHVLV
jgi:hypothetical protein